MDRYVVSEAFKAERDRDVTGMSFWRTCSLDQARTVMEDAILYTRKRMHGAHRTDMRTKIGVAVKALEKARAEG